MKNYYQALCLYIIGVKNLLSDCLSCRSRCITANSNIVTANNTVPTKKIQPIAAAQRSIASIDLPEIKNVKFTKSKTIVLKTNLVKKTVDYSIALINQDLLKPMAFADYKISAVSKKDKISTPKYFVKIEEEKSGAKNNNVYYFQLSRDSGKNAVKPLIFLKQPVKKPTAKKITRHICYAG